MQLITLSSGLNRVWPRALREGFGLWLLCSLVKDLIILHHLSGVIVLSICAVKFLAHVS